MLFNPFILKFPIYYKKIQFLLESIGIPIPGHHPNMRRLVARRMALYGTESETDKNSLGIAQRLMDTYHNWDPTDPSSSCGAFEFTDAPFPTPRAFSQPKDDSAPTNDRPYDRNRIYSDVISVHRRAGKYS